jgi:hypothetical protein
MNIKKFKHKWAKLKHNMTKKDIKFWFKVVDIDGRAGRRICLDIKDGYNFNPRYNLHFFPSGRCHFNVILPVYLLNEGNIFDDLYAIITNDKHSAIINIETNAIYDPTYEINGGSFETTKEMFKDGYKIVSLAEHCREVDIYLYQDILKFTGNLK